MTAVAVLTDIGEPGDTPSSPSGTTAPPDVDEPRAPEDIGAPPDVSSASSVARWWAATYTAYAAVDDPAALADRLVDVTTPEFDEALRSQPPADSYDEAPIEVDGVSQSPLVDGRLRVTVETPGALVVYEVTLVETASGWRVSGATRL